MKSVSDRIKEVELKIAHCKDTYTAILQIHTQVDRKKRSLEMDLKIFEEERVKLLQGQLPFDEEMGF